jgi:two-component system capsular synthesis response regulator RcsB
MDLSMDEGNVQLHGSQPGLSTREMQILRLIAKGYTGQGIAERLNISQKTVSTYKKRIREKFGVEKNVDLIRLAVQYQSDD